MPRLIPNQLISVSEASEIFKAPKVENQGSDQPEGGCKKETFTSPKERALKNVKHSSRNEKFRRKTGR